MRKFLGIAIALSSFTFALSVLAASQSAIISNPAVGGGALVQTQVVSPVSVTAASASACAVNLSWRGTDPNFAYYRIEFAKNATNFETQRVFVATTTATSYRHTLLEPGASYLYRVQIVANNKDISSWVDSGAPTLTPAIPGVSSPTNMVANQDPTQGTDGGMMARLAWSGSVSGGYQRYEVDRSTTNSFSSSFSATTPVPFYNDGTRGAWLDPNAQYWYRTRAVGTDADCAPEVRVTSGYAVTSVPKIPGTLLTNFMIAPNRMELSWVAGNGQSYYEIFRAVGNPIQSSFLASTSAGVYTDNAIVLNQNGNQTYWYKVRGCIGEGASKSCSGFSEDQGGGREVASAPQSFGARLYYATSTGAKALITWRNGAFKELNHELERSANGVSFSNIATRVSTASSTIFEQGEDVNLNEQQTYRARVSYGGGYYSDYSSGAIDTSIKYILHGAAWSAYGSGTDRGGVGWVSFNSDDTGLSGSTPWSVQINRDGQMSGVAWVPATSTISGDSGYGWLSFNKNDLVGCPDDPTSAVPTVNCNAVLKNGEVMGWARFLSPQYGTAPSTFSGWVSLNSKRISDGKERDTGVKPSSAVTYLWDSFKSAPSSWTPRGIFEKVVSAGGNLVGIARAAVGGGVSYNISLSGPTLTGVAWGSDGVGWIAFTNPSGTCVGSGGSCTVTVTLVNAPPVVSSVTVRTPSTINPVWCALSPYYSVDFDYTDPDLAGGLSDYLNKASIVLQKSPTGPQTILQTYGSSTFTITSVNPTTRHVAGAVYEDPFANEATPSTDYKVMVRAQDANDAWSPWAYSAVTTTPAYYYPLVSAGMSPDPAVMRKPVTFTDTTVVRKGSEVRSRQWVFNRGTPKNSASSTVSTLFATSTTSAGSLTVTDADGHMCSITLPPIEASTNSINHVIEER